MYLWLQEELSALSLQSGNARQPPKCSEPTVPEPAPTGAVPPPIRAVEQSPEPSSDRPPSRAPRQHLELLRVIDASHQSGVISQAQLVFTKAILVGNEDVVRASEIDDTNDAALEMRRLVGVLGSDATLVTPAVEDILTGEVLVACNVHCQSGVAVDQSDPSSLQLSLRVGPNYPSIPPSIDLSSARGITTGDLVVLEAQLASVLRSAANEGLGGYLLS